MFFFAGISYILAFVFLKMYVAYYMLPAYVLIVVALCGYAERARSKLQIAFFVVIPVLLLFYQSSRILEYALLIQEWRVEHPRIVEVLIKAENRGFLLSYVDEDASLESSSPGWSFDAAFLSMNSLLKLKNSKLSKVESIPDSPSIIIFGPQSRKIDSNLKLMGIVQPYRFYQFNLTSKE